MNAQEIGRLKYRRQYLIAPQEINCPFMHSKQSIDDNYILYAHFDLNKCSVKRNGLEVILLGDLFDYKDKHKGNEAILNDILDMNYRVFIKNTYKYTGRFVLIYIYDGEINIMHDAGAARKVYYNFSGNKCWLASHPKILAKVQNFKITEDKSKLDFYHSENHARLNNSNIGDTTCYDEIFQLMPNKFLSLYSQSIIRYWPEHSLKHRPVDEAAEICAKMIKGYMESIVFRYKYVMLPVTAGKDSRTLLAASRACSKHILYYTNIEKRMPPDSNDIIIPKRLIGKLGLNYKQIILSDDIDEEFKKLYYELNDFPSKIYLPHIYNYFKNHNDKVNLPGGFVGTGVYLTFSLYNNHLTPKILARFTGVANYPYAKDYYSRWLTECRVFYKKYKINLGTLFYWEERVANWGTQIQLFKDIAQEEIMPFNSRDLLSLFMGVRDKYNSEPDFILNQKIILLLWPETLSEPINPSLRKKILQIIKSLKLLFILRQIKAGIELLIH